MIARPHCCTVVTIVVVVGSVAIVEVAAEHGMPAAVAVVDDSRFPSLNRW